MNTRTLRNMMAVCGAAALIMTAGAFPEAAQAAAGGDAVIEANAREVLAHYIDTVSVKVKDGHVYVTGQFNLGGEKAAAMERISRINGVRGVYDYTEVIGSSK